MRAVYFFKIAFCVFVLSFLLNDAFGQDAGKFYQKEYYNQIFDEKAKAELKKVNALNIDGNEYFSKAKVFYEKQEELEKMADLASGEKAKNKAIKKAAKQERKAHKKHLKAIKLYTKANDIKYKVYTKNLSKVKPDEESNIIVKAIEYEDNAEFAFRKAETNRNRSMAYKGKEKVDLLVEAIKIERDALNKLEAAFGLYKNDADVILKHVVAPADSLRPEVSDTKNEKEQLAYVPDDSGSSTSINQYKRKEAIEKERPAEEQIWEKMDLSQADKTKLDNINNDNEAANKLIKDTDELYIKIDEFRFKAKHAETSKEKEQLSSEAVMLEMQAFSKLINAIKLHLKVNETKYGIYQRNISKVRFENSTLESIRGKQLEKEAEQYKILADERIKLAERQSFKSEQYKLYMESNEMFLVALQKYERAFGLYSNMVELNDEDIRLASDAPQNFFDEPEGKTEDKNKAETKTEKTGTVTAQTKESEQKTEKKSFNFEVKEAFVINHADAKPQTYVFPKSLVFMIQVGILKDLPSNALDILAPAVGEKFTYNPFTRYYLGNFKSAETAEYALTKVQKKLFKDAYVVAFIDGRRTSLKTAKKKIIDGEIMPVDDYKKLSYTELEHYKATGNTNLKSNKAKVSGTTDVANLNELFYTVQLGLYKSKPTEKELLGFNDIFTEKVKKGTKYTTGKFSNIDDAKKRRKEANKRGKKDAFVVAYYKGKQITLNKAKKIHESGGLVNGAVYKVKLGEFDDALSSNEFKLKFGKVASKYTISTIQDYKNNKVFYTVGEYHRKSEAEAVKKKLAKRGMSPIVVAFKGNEHLNYSETTESDIKPAKSYKVQIAAMKQALSDKEMKQTFKKVPKDVTISATYQKSINKTIYTVGDYSNYDKAAKLQKRLKKSGVDGFVIATVENKRVDLNYEPVKKKEKVAIQSNETSYKIQIGAFSKILNNKDLSNSYPNVFKNWKIDRTFDDASKTNLYTVGDFKTYKEASKTQKQIKEKGGNGFVVMFENGKKVPFDGIVEEEEEVKTVVKEKKEVEKVIEKEEPKQKEVIKVEVTESVKSYNVTYKIQLGSYTKNLNEFEIKDKFGKLPSKYDLKEWKDISSGNIIYTIGQYSDYDEAVRTKNLLKKQGIYGYVIAVKGNQKISLFEARKRENK